MKNAFLFWAIVALMLSGMFATGPSAFTGFSTILQSSTDEIEKVAYPTTNNVSNSSEGAFPGVKDDFYFASGSENDIYAIATDGNIWHWNGAWWWQVTSGQVIEKRIQAIAPNLIIGVSKNGEGNSKIYKWNGSNWTAITASIQIKDDFDFVSENEIYAIGQNNQIHLWNGNSWIQITSGQIGVKGHIQAASSSQIYGISTQGEILKWNGNTWQVLTRGENITDFFNLKSENEIYAIDSEQRVELWNGQNWTNLTFETSFRGRVHVNSPTEIYRLSLDKMIWQWNGEKWVQITSFITDAFSETGSTYYRVKYIEGQLAAPAAIIAFKEKLVIACQGSDNGVYIREWKPSRSESWDAARNSQNLGVNNWYSLNGATIYSPELAIENGTLFIYVAGANGGIYRKQFLNPNLWSSDWELVPNHELTPGPFSIAGFAVLPTNTGYPSPVSLVKFKKFSTFPPHTDLSKLIIYEISTREFTSPNGPGTGTFKSTQEKLGYLKDLGINTIWLSGSTWSDPYHFTNISTQYACIHPGLLDPSLGSNHSSIQETEQEFKDLVQAAHQLGMKVILDMVTHGVMSYSPLISNNSTFPSYVTPHPLQSTLIPHPDWFGALTFPTDEEMPVNRQSFPHDTRMIDFVGGYEQSDLDDWWVNILTNYVVDCGIDGFRLDLGSSRFDLWARVKEEALLAGKEILIMPEGEIDSYPFDVGIYDIVQAENAWIVFANTEYNNTSIGYGVIVTDMKKAHEELFPNLSKQFNTIPISVHDSFSYNIQGSRFKIGYASMFTPFIPIFMSGEDFNNPKVLVPNATVPWLLASVLQWNESEKPLNQLFYQDVKKVIALRKTEAALNYFSPNGNTPNIGLVENFTSSLDNTPTPYLRFLTKANEVILIVGNSNSNQNTTIVMNIPFNGTGVVDSEYYEIQDLWFGNTFYASKQQLKEFEITVEPQNFRIFKIISAGNINPTLLKLLLGVGVLVFVALALMVAKKYFPKAPNGKRILKG